ncbi:MAG: hypothetical protein ACI85U_003898, partial [Candidatus Promineifilaceae bacterium]
FGKVLGGTGLNHLCMSSISCLRLNQFCFFLS